MMRIVHILEDFSLKSGGIRTVVNDLHTRLLKVGFDSLIVTPVSEAGDEVIKVKGKGNVWLFSSKLKQTLKKLSKKKKIDIIHIHGVWMHPQYAAAKFALQNKISFIVSCHGMYEPWLWTKGTLKKKIYFNLISKPVFAKADKIHAITNNEALELNKLFPKTSILEIPNLIDFTDNHDLEYNPKDKYILYLGRLDEKKGIDLLVKAYKNVNQQTVKLKIAGEFNDYKKELDKLVNLLNLKNNVEFLGLVIGTQKEELFKNAFVFVAPSYSEVVGMVNLEAGILKTPVITTYQTGLDKEWSNNGGLLVNPTEEEITNALQKALNWSDKKRCEKGQQLHEFVLKKYSWKNRFSDWLKSYESIL